MTTRDVDQVLTGPGTFYVAPLGTAYPADAETAPAAAWEDVGYSDEGVAFEWDQERQEVTVAELVDPIRDERTRITYTLVIAFAQFILENVERALGGGTITAIPGPPVRRTYTPPASGAETALAGLFRFENEHDDGSGGKFHTDLQMPRIKSIGAGSTPFQLAPNKSIIPVEFKLEVPSAGDIFTFDEYVSTV